jgi:hypothetical protein
VTLFLTGAAEDIDSSATKVTHYNREYEAQNKRERNIHNCLSSNWIADCIATKEPRPRHYLDPNRRDAAGLTKCPA